MLGNFDLFGYQTFRMVLAAFIAFVVCVLFTNLLVRKFRAAGLFDPQEEHSDPEHVKELERQGKIPKSVEKPKDITSMGGIAIVIAIVVSVLLTTNLSSTIVIGGLILLLGMASLGLYDDYLKLKTKKGLSRSTKLAAGVLICAAVLAFLYYPSGPNAEFTKLWLPFNKNLIFQLGGAYAILFIFVISSLGHGVNVSDGIDGLSTGLVIIASITLAIVSYVAGHGKLSEYLYVAHVSGAGELAVLMSAVAGASLGFLWHNAAPATIYMGDTGSLALGSILGYTGLIAKQEILTFVVCGIFLIEILSVAIQIGGYKMTKKRFFPIAPIHIVFQKNGMPNNRIVNRAYIIGIFLAILALGTLKIR